MDGDPADIRPHQFTLARVKAGAHIQAKLLYRTGYRLCAPNRPARTIERCQHAIAGALDGAAPKPADLSLRKLVVCLQQVHPLAIAYGRGMTGRPNDISKKHRSEEPVWFGGRPYARHELLDLICDDVLRLVIKHKVVHPGNLDIPRFWDMLGQVARYVEIRSEEHT